MAATRDQPPPEGYTHSPAFATGHLPVGSIHKIYYHQYGNPKGKPVIFLHGGPGGRTTPSNTLFFNPEIYHVVLLDQRGSGQSLPVAEIRENTSQHLVSDLEALRTHLGIQKWHVVFGGSWGSTLALLYAQTHPEAVGSLVVRGIFTVRKEEVTFSRGPDGAARLFPEYFSNFINFLPPEERAEPYAAYRKRVISEDMAIALPAARSWNTWELAISRLVPGDDAFAALEDETWSLQHARMEAHYESNGAFMEEGQLLKAENLERIKHIPCSIVQGRYDIVCPPKTAWELHNALPGSRLYMIPDAGHSVADPGIKRKLMEICDEYGSEDFEKTGVMTA